MIKIFTKKDCPKCPAAKKLGNKLKTKYEVEFVDVETREGLADMSFYGFTTVPLIVIEDDSDFIIAQTKVWTEVPTFNEVDKFMREL